MTSVPGLRAAIDEAIFVDEVGIETGILGDFRLKSAYQPIFSREGETLVTAGVEAVPAFFLRGRQLTGEEFRMAAASLSTEVEALLQVLHLRNYRNIGLGEVDLFIDVDPASADVDGLIAALPNTARGPEEILLRPGMLVCEFGSAMRSDPEELGRLVQDMRWKDVCVALGVFGIGQAAEDEIELIRPDIVRIDGDWFEEICRDSATIRLFAPIVSALQDQGARVLVEGIDKAASLRAALDAEVDLFQGDLLALAALAGTVFDETPLPIASLLGGGRNVVRLFG